MAVVGVSDAGDVPERGTSFVAADPDGDWDGEGGGVRRVVVGGRVGQIGRTELRASSSICAMASSSEPPGRPASTCARSDSRMSCTLSS